MSESFEVHSSLRDYQVDVGAGLLDALLRAEPALHVVCDQQMLQHWPSVARRAGVIPVLAEEARKDLSSVAQIIESLRRAGATRGSRMLAVGGGVVQDLATMASSIYMRGIDWVYCPTTLLGMVDSCLGGKSSINVGEFKNIAGNYFPPSRILIDPVFCRTLPGVQRVAGLCEAAKICFCSRDEAFGHYQRLMSGVDVFDDESALVSLISLSLRTKKVFIEQDEFDQGIRLLLNFGHTFGHALEGASGFALSHGIAVGVGMLAAIDFARRIGLADGSAARTLALRSHVRELLAGVPDLAGVLGAIDPEQALRRFQSDKKHQTGRYAVIVVNREGFVERIQLPADPETAAHIRGTFGAVKELVA